MIGGPFVRERTDLPVRVAWLGPRSKRGNMPGLAHGATNVQVRTVRDLMDFRDRHAANESLWALSQTEWLSGEAAAATTPALGCRASIVSRNVSEPLVV